MQIDIRIALPAHRLKKLGEDFIKDAETVNKEKTAAHRVLGSEAGNIIFTVYPDKAVD